MGCCGSVPACLVCWIANAGSWSFRAAGGGGGRGVEGVAFKTLCVVVVAGGGLVVRACSSSSTGAGARDEGKTG